MTLFDWVEFLRVTNICSLVLNMATFVFMCIVIIAARKEKKGQDVVHYLRGYAQAVEDIRGTK